MIVTVECIAQTVKIVDTHSELNLVLEFYILKNPIEFKTSAVEKQTVSFTHKLTETDTRKMFLPAVKPVSLDYV